MFGEVGFVSGLARLGRGLLVRVRRSRHSVWTCSAKSGYCRDVFDEVFLVSGRVRRVLLIVGTCSTTSA